MAEPAVAVAVDTSRCVGSATCTVVAAGIFGLDEHDQAELLVSLVGDVEAVEQAAQLCPTGAIRIDRVGPGRPGG